jgi:hypothetical protein
VNDSAIDILTLGLPESGKSTYLGALYYLLRKRADERLQLASDPKERDYLQELENHWLRFRAFERSTHPGAREIQLDLRGPSTGEVSLSIPDISGESYNHLWEDGIWSTSVRELAASADGIMLFLRPAKLKVPELIDVSLPPQEDGSQPVDWKAEMSPTQSVICDLLELIGNERSSPVESIAVVVAAWDTATDLGVEPAKWLELQVPLLWQWLSAQEDPFRFQVFGISAQGGDVDDEETRKRLAENPDPLTRVLDGPGADGLLDPLLWLLRA